VIVGPILEHEDVDLLEVNVARMEADSTSEKGPQQCRHCERSNHISRSAGRNLVDLSGYNFLSLIHLLRVALLGTIHPLPPSS